MQLILDDARRALARMPDESVDLIVSDVPYPVISGGTGYPARPTGMLSANDGKIFKHNDIDVAEYADDLYRVLRDRTHCYIFTNELNRRKMEDAFERAGFRQHSLLVWMKQNATPNRWYMKNFEQVLMLRKGPVKTINNPGTKACLLVDNPIGDKHHPTEKPVDLLRVYIENSSNEGDVVLDPFMGSGSTGAACLASGREFVGIEVDPVYYGVACQRLGRLPGL